MNHLSEAQVPLGRAERILQCLQHALGDDCKPQGFQRGILVVEAGHTLPGGTVPYPGLGAACWLGDLHLPCKVLDIPNVLNGNVFFTN